MTDSEVAAETTAALASTSMVFWSSDPDYAKKQLERALMVFDFADAHKGSYSESHGKWVCPFYCDFSGYEDNVFVTFVASIQYRALGEKAVDAFYKLSNTKGQIQSYVFDADSSEDDSNASLELNRGSTSSCSKGSATTPNTNGKTRASRGSATDSESLYARKRRERINDRLRILQGLVPNGTKVVDVSTMLEDAVQYVKFLQLQIKLLSSDDLWMYSPIAYNGMNIRLDLIMARTKQ